jgi:hypothetical protein
MAFLELCGRVCIVPLLLSLAACDYGAKVAAPLGDKAALEKLADAYRAVEESQQVGGSPLSLPPEKRKKFVEMVFAEAGYSYSATLHSLGEGMSQGKLKVVDQNIKDLAELLLIPHRAAANLENIYSAQELQDVRAIESKLK